MRPVRAFALAGLLAALASPAAAQADFCAMLDQLKAAALEPQAFESLKAAPEQNEPNSTVTVPGFAVHSCRIANYGHDFGQGTGIWCRQSLAPPELSLDILASEMERCTGVKGVREDEWNNALLFDLGPVTVMVDEDGTDRAHVGRSVEFAMRRSKPAG